MGRRWRRCSPPTTNRTAQPESGQMRRRLGWRDRVRPMLMGAGGILGGDDFVAAHMAWGAVNEWMTQAGYSLLGRRADHPVLSELVGRIMRQEGRHIDFYSSQAHERLNASERAQRLVRFALQRFWKPVGTGVMPEAETRFLARYLMTDEAGRKPRGGSTVRSTACRGWQDSIW